MRNIFIISFLLFGSSLSAQRGDSSRRAFTDQERNELGSFVQFGISGGILTNVRNEMLSNVRPEISFGGRLRVLLAPSFYWTPGNSRDSMSTGYLLVGIGGQHIHQGFLFQGKLMTVFESGRNIFQIAAGMGIPLTNKAWFRLEYTAQREQRSTFSGNMLSGGLLISF
ncbi:MAG: hypothetical protein KJS92_06360 [Bacteroidetes bacterium]|nr:hypothetical protein [Bacteroidota bacterium]